MNKANSIDLVSGRLQLRAAKIGSNSAKVRAIAKRFAYDSTLYAGKGKVRVVSVSEGKNVVVSIGTGETPTNLVRRKRQENNFAESLDKCLTLSHKRGIVMATKPNAVKPAVDVSSLPDFKAWKETQNSYRKLARG